MTSDKVDPLVRREIARQGAYAVNAQYDPHDLAMRALQSKKERWEREIDPTGELARTDPAALEHRLQMRMNQQMAAARQAAIQKRQGRARDAARRAHIAEVLAAGAPGAEKPKRSHHKQATTPRRDNGGE